MSIDVDQQEQNSPMHQNQILTNYDFLLLAKIDKEGQ